jgi:predicted transcriptional regulator
MTAKRSKMGRPRKLAAEKMGATLNMRLDAETAKRLDALADKVRDSGMGRSTVARLCMLAGLELATRDPARVLLGLTRKERT